MKEAAVVHTDVHRKHRTANGAAWATNRSEIAKGGLQTMLPTGSRHSKKSRMIVPGNPRSMIIGAHGRQVSTASGLHNATAAASRIEDFRDEGMRRE
jgi:hypothetical protein